MFLWTPPTPIETSKRVPQVSKFSHPAAVFFFEFCLGVGGGHMWHRTLHSWLFGHHRGFHHDIINWCRIHRLFMFTYIFFIFQILLVYFLFQKYLSNRSAVCHLSYISPTTFARSSLVLVTLLDTADARLLKKHRSLMFVSGEFAG